MKPDSGCERRWNVRPIFLVLAAICFGVVLLGVFLPHEIRPPWPVQREEQRRVVRERVQTAGGWDVSGQECGESCGDIQSSHYCRVVGSADSKPEIPPSIVQLRPRVVEAYALPGEPVIARIKLFGTHATGMRGVPFYGLWIVCSPTTADYTPKVDFRGVTVTGMIEKVDDYVFEVY